MVGKVAESSQYLVHAVIECMNSAIDICVPKVSLKT